MDVVVDNDEIRRVAVANIDGGELLVDQDLGVVNQRRGIIEII